MAPDIERFNILTAILLGRIIICLFFSYCRVVVDEDECTVVLGIHIPLCALVSRTEITLPCSSTIIFNSTRPIIDHTYAWVICRQLVLTWLFLLALPRPFRPMRRDQHPRASQRVVATMRYVIEDCVGHIGGFGGRRGTYERCVGWKDVVRKVGGRRVQLMHSHRKMTDECTPRTHEQIYPRLTEVVGSPKGAAPARHV